MARKPLLHALKHTDQDRFKILRPPEDQSHVRAQVLLDKEGRRIRFESPPQIQHYFG